MTPYQLAAVDYAGFGWSPIPLPSGEKHPPPDGYTGADGIWVGDIQAREWAAPRARYNAGKVNFPVGNVALRLPRGVLGVDVDAYDDRAGAKTLAAAEKAWGVLPPTWVASSRPGTGSGIRLYRVPEGLAWPESLRKFHGGGVDLIRWDHRYAIVAPSLHPSGAQYVWGRPDGQWVTDEVPTPDDLPSLPPAWVEGLTSGKTWEARATEELSQDDIRAWLAERGTGGVCSVMSATLAKYQRTIRQAGDDGGAHDEARNGAWALIGDAAAGHSGVLSALGKLRNTFLEAVKGRREERQARGEWARILIRGVQKVVAEGEPSYEDPCALFAESERLSRSRTGSGAFDYTRDDIGNAQRLVHWVGDDMKYIEGLGGWHIWDGKRWVLDRFGQIQRWAFEVVRNMEKEAEFIEEPKARAAFIAWIRSSGGAARLKAMIDLARSMKGMTWSASDLDANPRLLACPNGVLELGEERAVFRPVDRTDKVTMLTNAEYVDGAVSELWEKFITRAVPDVETRRWLQKALGYCLLGRNPARLLFLLQGKTSSGKTTLAEAVRHALGEYAAPFNLSLFRAVKDTGANVQLVRLLGKRFIVASEASSDWFLHADEIKRITGGDAVSARLNHANELIEAVPAFTPWIVSNDPPTINGADLALYRRMYTIPMDQTISAEEEDTTVRERLQGDAEAASGVLSWLVEGWNMWAAERLTDVPAEVVKATMTTREELSDFDGFLHDCCVQEALAAATAADLYEAYKSWCGDNGVKTDTAQMFGRQLSKRGIDRKRLRIGEDAGDGREKAWVRIGIRLRSGWLQRVGGTPIDPEELT